MNTIGSVEKCGTCQREILVEQILIGTNHTAGILLTCWSCLKDEMKAKAETLYGLEKERMEKEEQ